jgi:hypothetical protein
VGGPLAAFAAFAAALLTIKNQNQVSKATAEREQDRVRYEAVPKLKTDIINLAGTLASLSNAAAQVAIAHGNARPFDVWEAMAGPIHTKNLSASSAESYEQIRPYLWAFEVHERAIIGEAYDFGKAQRFSSALQRHLPAFFQKDKSSDRLSLRCAKECNAASADCITALRLLQRIEPPTFAEQRVTNSLEDLRKEAQTNIDAASVEKISG